MSSIQGRLIIAYGCSFVLSCALCVLVAVFLDSGMGAGITGPGHVDVGDDPNPRVAAEGGWTSLVGRLADPAMLMTGALGVAGASLLLSFYCTFGVLRTSRADVRSLRRGILSLVQNTDDLVPDSLVFEEFRRCASDLECIAKELRLERASLSDNAFHDDLTGLQNRKPFMDALERELVSACRQGRPLSCIMADLDHFKALNDTHGHKAGDDVLKHTARRLESLVREGDVVARLGGEEFAILLPGADLKTGMRIAQQLRNALRCDEFILNDKKVHISASFGVAEIFACNLTDSDDLLHAADMALYEAKRGGRDRVSVAPISATSPLAEDTEDPSPSRNEDEEATESEHARRPDHNKGIDRDTLALMGSTFSMLQAMPDKHRVAKDMIHQVAAVLRAGRVLLLVRDPYADRLLPMATLGLPSYEVVPSIPLPNSEEVLSGMVATPETYYQPAEDDPILEAVAPDQDPASALYLPLSSDEGVFGVIVVLGLEGTGKLTRRKNTVLQAISAIGATALINCNLYSTLEDRWMGSIETLSAAIEEQDEYKKEHGSRVGQVAIEIARSFGQQDGRHLKMLKLAGCLLDIGMLSVPVEIRQKKRRLQQSERLLIEQHAQIGFGILQQIAGMEHLADIVLHHHEHYDGHGYPDRLEGDEIPIESRILGVADAYCAMTADRPYRPRMSHDAAVQQIIEASGTQFDPAIVNAFLTCVDRPEEVTPTEAEPTTPS